MKTLPALLTMAALLPGLVFAQLGRSSLQAEPGTLPLEDILPRPVQITVPQESTIYYHATFDRALGSIAPGTTMALIGMSDQGFRVRGRARHGDVSGWLKKNDVKLPDPTLPDKLKAFYQRQTQVAELIAAHQVALGMSREEVQKSMGKPTRTSRKVTADGQVEHLEYSIFEKVPQQTFGRAPNGEIVQSVIYVKVEVGTLGVSFKNGTVDAIEETKGNPLRGATVKIVPGPVVLR